MKKILLQSCLKLKEKYIAYFDDLLQKNTKVENPIYYLLILRNLKTKLKLLKLIWPEEIKQRNFMIMTKTKKILQGCLIYKAGFVFVGYRRSVSAEHMHT